MCELYVIVFRPLRPALLGHRVKLSFSVWLSGDCAAPEGRQLSSLHVPTETRVHVLKTNVIINEVRCELLHTDTHHEQFLMVIIPVGENQRARAQRTTPTKNNKG